MEEHRGWHDRGYIPHFDVGEITQSITFRLGDSLPQERLRELQDLAKAGEEGIVERQNRIEYYLDQGMGSCVLKDPACASIIEDALEYLNGKRFDLIAWVIMPNHVHFLARFGEGQLLSKAMHSLKSFTSNEIGKLYPELRPVWQTESFDRYIRSEEHYWHAVRYIHENPVKAGLSETAEAFPWSSASGRGN